MSLFVFIVLVYTLLFCFGVNARWWCKLFIDDDGRASLLVLAAYPDKCCCVARHFLDGWILQFFRHSHGCSFDRKPNWEGEIYSSFPHSSPSFFSTGDMMMILYWEKRKHTFRCHDGFLHDGKKNTEHQTIFPI